MVVASHQNFSQAWLVFRCAALNSREGAVNYQKHIDLSISFPCKHVYIQKRVQSIKQSYNVQANISPKAHYFFHSANKSPLARLLRVWVDLRVLATLDSMETLTDTRSTYTYHAADGQVLQLRKITPCAVVLPKDCCLRYLHHHRARDFACEDPPTAHSSSPRRAGPSFLV